MHNEAAVNAWKNNNIRQNIKEYKPEKTESFIET